MSDREQRIATKIEANSVLAHNKPLDATFLLKNKVYHKLHNRLVWACFFTKVQFLLKSLVYQGISLFLLVAFRFDFEFNFLPGFLNLQDSIPRILIEYGF